MFKVYAAIDQSLPPTQVAAFAQRAEKLGYTGLNVPDAVHEGLTLATLALIATTRLKVATGVLVAFPRSPMMVAQAAWDLQAVSCGRFELGLGTQVKGNIIGRYSATWSPPVPRMREYVLSLRKIFSAFQYGTELNFSGEHYQFTRLQPFFNPGPIEFPEIPIFLGAVGPAMTTLVGSVADGLMAHPTNTSPRYIREVIQPRLLHGAEKSSRSSTDIKLMLGSLVATGPTDEIVEQRLEKQRQLLAFLYSTPAYWPSLELYGWEGIGHQLHDLSKSGGWGKMAGLITNQILEEFVAIGTYQNIAEVLEQRYAGISDWITFPIPEDSSEDEQAREVIDSLQG